MGIINKPLFPKIAKRFSVQQDNNQMLQTSDALVPITNADDYVRTAKLNSTTTTAASGAIYLEVPAGKRWYLKGADAWRINTGTIYLYIDGMINGVYQVHNINDPNPTSSVVYARYDPGQPIIMEEGWTITGDFGAGTSGMLGISIVYEEEDMQ